MSRLLIALACFAYFTIVLGSWVRNAGAGLSCPDWPLCHGNLIPPMEYRIMLEYFHRLAAATVSILLLVIAFYTVRNPLYRRSFGKWIAAAGIALACQIILGALTVTRLLQWEVVATHLGVAVIFLSCILGASWKARRLDLGSSDNTVAISRSFFWTARLAVIVVFAQVLLGGSVSSHYAGLACPDFPTCHGDWFPGFSGLVGIQFMHRLWAVVASLTVLGFIFQYVHNAKLVGGRKNLILCAAGILVLLQWALGIGMILYGSEHSMAIPAPFSVAHLAIGVLIFILILCANYDLQSRQLR